jgi:hypothetical protein
VKKFLIALFSPKFEYFIVPIIIGWGYLLATIVNGVIAYALELAWFIRFFGFSFSAWLTGSEQPPVDKSEILFWLLTPDDTSPLVLLTINVESCSRIRGRCDQNSREYYWPLNLILGQQT